MLLHESLIGVHAITGCDTVSTFSVKGSGKQSSFFNAIKGTSELWQESGRSGQYLRRPSNIRRHSCQLYRKNCQSVEVLHGIHCARGGKVKPQAMPPCESSLRFVSRAKQQSCKEPSFTFVNPLPSWVRLGSRRYLKRRGICVAWV